MPATEARRRIVEAVRRLLRDQPFHELTVERVMAEAELARTVFYRHFDDLPQLAPELLPDADAPLIERVGDPDRDRPQDVVDAMLDSLVAVFADHGPLLRAIDDAAARDAAVSAELDRALVAPRALLERLLRGAPHPPPDPRTSALLLMAAHRAFLLDEFASGNATPAARRRARIALGALWSRLLA